MLIPKRLLYTLPVQLVLKTWEVIFNCKDKVFTGKNPAGQDSHYGIDQVSGLPV
jgi:hypothetical protein